MGGFGRKRDSALWFLLILFQQIIDIYQLSIYATHSICALHSIYFCYTKIRYVSQAKRWYLPPLRPNITFTISFPPVINLWKQQFYQGMVPLPTRREDRLRITTTLLGGTHRCVPYGVIVFSLTFSIFYLIYNCQRSSEICHLPFVIYHLYNQREAS